MNICEKFLKDFRENSLSGWKAELTSTFADFKTEKVYGNSYDFGDFDKCINFGLDENEGIQGKYCSVQYYSTAQDTISVMPKSSFFNQGWQHLDSRFGGAVCIPSTCNANTFVPQLMELILNGTKYVMSSDYDQDEFCQVKKHFLMTTSGFFGISFVLFFIILAIVSTIKSYRNPESIYLSFSLTRNLKNLIYDENNDDTIAYLRGIKTISHYVTAFIHMILASLYIPTNNSQNILAYHQGEYEMVISQGPAGTTFCQMITSFLLTRALWKLLELKRLNIPMMYIYRYLRIVPLLFFVMVVERFIMQGWVSEFVEAPYFFPNQFTKAYKLYWLPLLQIQNYFVDLKETFLLPSYYFAVDFHLFMLTPFVVFLLWKWRRSSYIVFLSLLVIAYGINYSYIIGNKEYFQNMKYLSYEEKTLSRYIQETQFALPGWIFGMMFGYLTITVKVINIDRNSISSTPVINPFSNVYDI
ncbi:uncharacterized protein [Chironomus tepperi]|uniref:uncharacterized protein n=1 Tax=Chironomus tepperi TaxID=113505 RepID=UPI00391F2477